MNNVNKPFSFLSICGGKQTQLQGEEEPAPLRRVVSAQRVASALGKGGRTLRSEQEDLEGLIREETLKQARTTWSGKRPLTGKHSRPSMFFMEFTKERLFSECNLPYENLFDRNERTIAAPIVRAQSFRISSPNYRIGLFMQEVMKFRRKSLTEIVEMQKTLNLADKSAGKVAIQLRAVDHCSLEPRGDKHLAYQKEPESISLFPEILEQGQQAAGLYDPSELGRRNHPFISEQHWPEWFRDKVALSIQRFRHYVDVEFLPREVPRFKKEWIRNAFQHIPEALYEDGICKAVMDQIIQNFKRSAKEAIVHYLLKNGQERARLGVLVLPRSPLSSAARIAFEGGYSKRVHSSWHSGYSSSRAGLAEHIRCFNPVTCALQGWFSEFAHLRLAELRPYLALSTADSACSLYSFISHQEMHFCLSEGLLYNVFYRGVLLIIKQHRVPAPARQPVRWGIKGYYYP